MNLLVFGDGHHWQHFALNLNQRHARSDTARHDRVLLQVEVLNESDDRVASQADRFEADFTLHLPRELHERDLPRLVRSGSSADLVQPVVLRIVVDGKFFDEAANYCVVA